jgi:hypothetical protein
MQVAEIFIAVGFAVVVEVDEPGDLIAAEDVHFVVDNAEAEGLKEAGGEAFPSELFEFVVHAADAPHIAVHGADRDVAIGE